MIEKPPVGGKELLSLNQLQLAGFRLHPGPLPEQYRSLLNQVQAKEKKKHKKKKHRGSETPAHEDGRTGKLYAESYDHNGFKIQRISPCNLFHLCLINR